MATNDPWLAVFREEALEPAQPIIDPHPHLWGRPGSRCLLERPRVTLAEEGR